MAPKAKAKARAWGEVGGLGWVDVWGPVDVIHWYSIYILCG